MKKLATAVMMMFVLSLSVIGCASKGDTKDDAAVTEGAREIEPATSGGMQRMEEEEEAAPADDAPAEPAASPEDEPAPE